jgi:alkylation response protein AidB-like acyl-CoA dehydrogenase
VSLAIHEDHLALADTARRFLETRCPPDVARSQLDSPHESLPPFWAELAGLGWLGLHVPEADGGQGYGWPELAVVLEELGRAAAPGPVLSTVLAATLIDRNGDRGRTVLADLVSGRAVGAVGFPATSVLQGSVGADGAITVDGTARPVLSAHLADWLLLAVGTPAGERWCLMAANDLEVQELPSVDLTRRVGSVTARAVVVPAERQLALDRQQVEDAVATLVAAECAGGAGWCLDTASEYAKVREQFGRPIGQFQAVKHRCADLLIAVEQARGAAWDAARAPRDTEPNLAAAVAGAVAPEVYARAAKDCIQLLGGIGFTWEHDAHRYLRRSITLRQLMGGPGPWRGRVAELASAGTRQAVAVDLPPEAEAVREGIRRTVEAIAAQPKDQWRAALVERGLMVPHWPDPWGHEASAVEQVVIDQELARAHIRRANLAVGAWAAPTIAVHGTLDQQERWVRPTLLGTISWCQLFSEPGAGSDLASLTTKAVKTDGGWLLSGQKVWTSMAGGADWGICLARTNPSAPKHLGITYFIVDMNQAGIDIRPLRELTGHAMFNEVFLTDVFVADDCVIGEVDGGWPLARTTLANERVAMGSGSSFGGGVEALLALVADIGMGQLDAEQQSQLGALLAEAHTVGLLGQRAAYRAVSGAAPGPEASVRKLLGVEHDQRTQEFGLSLLGGEAATNEGPAAQWVFGFLANRCLTIAGGTSEVQRNVIAERLLGLPRD